MQQLENSEKTSLEMNMQNLRYPLPLPRTKQRKRKVNTAIYIFNLL